MGRASQQHIDLSRLDPREDFAPLDFDAHDASEHPDWGFTDDLTEQELAMIESDAEIADYRMNGYE